MLRREIAYLRARPGLEYYDKCALDDIVKAVEGRAATSSPALVLAVVKSDPFQKRKGKRSE